MAAVFQQYTRRADGRQCASPDLERRLREILDACRAAWPEVDVSEHAFVRHLAESLPDDGDLDGSLSRMHCPDLYLAWGCAAAEPSALAVFDSRILGRAVPALHRMGLPASQVDEVIQVLRAKLLVGDESGRRPMIATYAGRGPLVSWVRTAARRAAVSLRRNKDEQLRGAEDGRSNERIALPGDIELDYIKNRYRNEFKQAVEDALAALDGEQLQVLRLHYVEGLSIDRIGALLNVHRATAARRIHAASDAVRAETRRLLHARLGLSASELDSLAGLVQSQLHLSMGRLLQAP